jgi:type II secretory pathway pseudopilin PulG
LRLGYSAPELALVLALVGVLAVISVPRLSELRDRAAVRAAANDVASAVSLARRLAILRGARTSVLLDSAGGTVVVRAAHDTVLFRPLGELYRTTFRSRGFGAANATIIVGRRSAAETVWVSRLGRVRR